MNGKEQVIVIFFLAALVVIVSALYLRYRKQQMLHQERMAALEKGLTAPTAYSPQPWSPKIYLLRGLLWSFAGAAIGIVLLGIAVSTNKPQSPETVVWRANRLSIDAAIPLQEAKRIIEKDSTTQKDGMPFGLALFGLIPLAVGAAYLVFYYTGAKKQTNVPE